MKKKGRDGKEEVEEEGEEGVASMEGELRGGRVEQTYFKYIKFVLFLVKVCEMAASWREADFLSWILTPKHS